MAPWIRYIWVGQRSDGSGGLYVVGTDQESSSIGGSERTEGWWSPDLVSAFAGVAGVFPGSPRSAEKSTGAGCVRRSAVVVYTMAYCWGEGAAPEVCAPGRNYQGPGEEWEQGRRRAAHMSPDFLRGTTGAAQAASSYPGGQHHRKAEQYYTSEDPVGSVYQRSEEWLDPPHLLGATQLSCSNNQVYQYRRPLGHRVVVEETYEVIEEHVGADRQQRVTHDKSYKWDHTVPGQGRRGGLHQVRCESQSSATMEDVQQPESVQRVVKEQQARADNIQRQATEKPISVDTVKPKSPKSTPGEDTFQAKTTEKRASADSLKPNPVTSDQGVSGLIKSESEDIFPGSDLADDLRLSRLRELKERLSSPAHSVASGQFDDTDADSVSSSTSTGQGRRSRTTSEGSDVTYPSHIPTQLHNLVIPLPDSSEILRAKYSSMDNLRDSPIPLPDCSGLFSPMSEDTLSAASCTSPTTLEGRGLEGNVGGYHRGTEAHSFSTQQEQPRSRETTPVAGTSGFTPLSATGPSRTANTGSYAHYKKKEKSERMESEMSSTASTSSSTATGRAAPGDPEEPRSNPREPYTPGSYLANRDKYYGKSTKDEASHTSSSSSTSSTKQSSEFESSTSTKISESQKGLRVSKSDASILEHLGSTKINVDDRDFSQKRETVSDTYASSADLRNSLLMESVGRDSLAKDSESRDSLVKQVLAREAKERERVKSRPEQKASSRPEQKASRLSAEPEQRIPVDVVLDSGRLSAIRESLENAHPSGYSLKDYKDYVARNYGEEEAARIRDSTPKPFSVRYDSPTGAYTDHERLGHREGPSYQPYYVSNEDTQSVSSEKSEYDHFLRGKTESLLSDKSYSDYESRGTAGSYGGYDMPRRTEGLSSDRGYSSSGQRSSGYRSDDYSERVSSGEQAYRPSKPHAEWYGGGGGGGVGGGRGDPGGERGPPGYEREPRPEQEEARSEKGARQRQYQRSSSTDSTSSSYRRERQTDTRRKRRSLFDRPSLFDRDGIRDLLDDMLDDGELDKFNLWDRHSTLLRDDDFCRDFFTKDWDWPDRKKPEDDDDFFSDISRRKSSKKTREVRREMREEDKGRGHRVHRMKRTESMESDSSAGGLGRGPSERAAHGSSSSSSGTARHQDFDQRSESSSSSGGSSRDRRSTNSTAGSNVFNDAKFKFGSFGSFDEGEEKAGRGEGQERGSKGEGQERGSKSEGQERGSKGEGRGAAREEKKEEEGGGGGGHDGWDKDTLFFRDFDDLVHRFKDLKWKSAFQSYDKDDKGDDKEKGQ